MRFIHTLLFLSLLSTSAHAGIEGTWLNIGTRATQADHPDRIFDQANFLLIQITADTFHGVRTLGVNAQFTPPNEPTPARYALDGSDTMVFERDYGSMRLQHRVKFFMNSDELFLCYTPSADWCTKPDHFARHVRTDRKFLVRSGPHAIPRMKATLSGSFGPALANE